MITAIIQARMNSTRLPGKVLMDICGKPMLQRVIDRVKESKLIDEIIIATGNNPSDRPIINFISGSGDKTTFRGRHTSGKSFTYLKDGIKGFCGSETDVLDRYFEAAIAHSCMNIVRITSDCPLIDPQVIDTTIKYHLDGGYDYTSNIGSYPDGLDTEVLSYKTLDRAWKEATDPYDREHVTSYIRSHPELFKIGRLESGEDFSHLKLSVDTVEDLEFVKWLYGKLENKFYLEDILKLLEEEKNVKI